METVFLPLSPTGGRPRLIGGAGGPPRRLALPLAISCCTFMFLMLLHLRLIVGQCSWDPRPLVWHLIAPSQISVSCNIKQIQDEVLFSLMIFFFHLVEILIYLRLGFFKVQVFANGCEQTAKAFEELLIVVVK